MKRWCVAALCLGLGACDKGAPPLAAYRHPRDALASVLPLHWFGVHVCGAVQKENGMDVIIGVPVDQCYKMRPAQRFHGIWLDEFEGSRFFENARDADSVKAQMRRSLNDPTVPSEWLDWPINGKTIRPRNLRESRLVALEFIGRRTAYPGRYGHMGVARSEVVVDRIILARTIYRSRKPYLEGELGSK